MKIFGLGVMFLLVACGKADNRGGVSLGQTTSFNPVLVDSSTAKTVSLICNALSQKNPTIGTAYVFDYSQKNCSSAGSDLASTNSVVSTTIESNSGTLYFRKNDQTQLAFDFETPTSGLMGLICSTLDSLKNQILTSSGELITFSTLSQDMNGKCVNGSNQSCIMVVRHAQSAPNSGVYKAQTKDWLKININNNQGRVGFWTERVRITIGDCANNLQQELKIVLR